MEALSKEKISELPNDMETIQDALEPIVLHHPEQRVWLECQPA